MSFDLVCPHCGAPSGPSVGVCPFCKTVLSELTEKENRTLTAIKKLYQEGSVEDALAMITTLVLDKKQLEKNVNFLLLSAKLLMEAEGPTSKIRNQLTRALLVDPDHKDVNEYLEVIEAKALLKEGLNDYGEQGLKAILRRSPDNVHALFYLGTHLYWIEHQEASAIRYLERCVQVRPNFLRAWGCLGSIYDEIGEITLASRAFRKCIELEKNERMRAFFKQRLNETLGNISS